jgi:ribose-phosphate pyrophosphokinase
MHDFKIATGRSNPELANRVANILGIDLSETKIQNFSDGEIWVKFEDNVRGIDLFIIQSTFPPADNIFELLMLIDAAKRASVKRVTAVIPYYGYSRQDRKDQPRVSITAKLVANLLERAGADRVITIDLHSSQIQGFFDIPLDNIYASPVLLKAARKLGLDPVAVAAPDMGSVKTARAYAKKLDNANLVIIDKRRPIHNVAEVMHIIGEPANKHVFIVDDMIDTGTTFINCAEAIKEKGALDIYGICVHPVLSGNAIDKINNSEAIKNVFVTDTIPLRKSSDKFIVASVAELLAEAIIRTHDNRSISSLFEIER